MAQRVPITVRLESFEGPLDLLLYLIQSHEMDINRISIGRITDQYLGYVRLMQELNFDIASEFLVMAATLLHWKSKALLPQEEKAATAGAEEAAELTQEELIRQLLEHQRFRAAGEDLAQLPMLNEDVFTRSNRRQPVERIWKEMNITDLALSYQDMLTRLRKRTTILKKETVSIADKINDFSGVLKIGKMTELTKLLSMGASNAEIVVTFLASLELARLKKLRVYQEETYKEIYLELIEALTGFDTQMANGFDAIATAEAQIKAGIAAPTQAEIPMPPSAFDLESFGEPKAESVFQTSDEGLASSEAPSEPPSGSPAQGGTGLNEETDEEAVTSAV